MPIPSTPSIMPNVLGYAADTVQIPETTPTGQGIPSFRDLFPFITQVDPDAGGVMVERAWMNALFNLLGQHAFFQQSGCVYPWQATLNYIAGSHVKGSDDVEYIALQHSGPDVSGTGAKDPTLEANRNYWISLSSFVSGDFVPDSRRVIAGTGLTGGGPLSADVTLAAKLTDLVNLTDSTTAASATAVKTAYDLANSKQANLGFTPVQQGGGTGQGTNKVYIGWATDASGLKAQADSTNLGNIVTTEGGTIKAPQAALADRAEVANNADKLGVSGWGYTSWNSTPYTVSPLYLWCLPTGGSDMQPCSPSVLSVFSTEVTPNVRVGNDGSVLPAGGTWRIMTSRNGEGTIMDLAGGSTVNTSGGVFMAIRVA
nr:MAG TPA: hypothetical protein [Caudoviricetes sp.]